MQAASRNEKARKWALLKSLHKEHSPTDISIVAQWDLLQTSDLQR